MSRPRPAQMKTAERLLAHEGASGGSAEECARAAGRVYEKLNAQLAPLLGPAGVKALFVRSAKLAKGERAALAEAAVFESSAELREYLRAQAPTVAAETATALFETFFALITTLIGERLTSQALRSGWPTIEQATAGETDK